MASNDNISKPFESVPKLSGKENYVTWKQRLTLALILTRSNSFISTPTPSTWTDRDSQIAAAILSTTSESILSAHIDYLNESTTELPRSCVIFKALEKLYGTSGPQYSFALGRKFLESRCVDQEDVEAWVNQVQAQYRELKLLKLDLDALCINVLLNGLPDRFGSFVDSIWTAEKYPSIEDIKISILRVNAGQLNSSNEKALAARKASLSLDPTTSLSAFYAGLKKSGKKPSRAHLCARYDSPTHWVVDCTKPTDDTQVITLLEPQATGLANAEYDLTVVSLANKDARATNLPNQDTNPSRLVNNHKVRHHPSSTLPFQPVVFFLGGMMNGSTTKVFASWKRFMTRGTYNLMLKRLSLLQARVRSFEL
ncbi:hypothetical protein JCM24511_02030 [Saitozyma sp. JCM 24511]|nr:hypothetical protein JCM24511_02030 [Saitozyma sp. JCM 24511]